VNTLKPVSLIDALSGWGLREATVKHGMVVPSDESQRTMLGMDVVLRHVPKLIAQILLAEPLGVAESRGVLRVDFGPEESDKLRLYDGTLLATYTDWVSRDETWKVGQYVRRLVKTPDFLPLVCAVRVAEEDPDRLEWPAAIYDGWHRAAAWLTSAREGFPYRYTADLIKTRRPPFSAR